MANIQPINSVNSGFSTISTGRNSDNSHAYIASRINDLYIQALGRQARNSTSSSARSLRRFIDSSSKDGTKLHKIV